MAEVGIGRRDLQYALLRMPRYPHGMKYSSEIVTETLRLIISDDLEEQSWTQMHFKKSLSCMEQFLKSDQSPDIFKKYFDDDPPFQLEKSILTGSWSEGLFLLQPTIVDPPDMDFMCILKNISFSEEDQACGNLAVREDTPFVNAYLSNKELLKTWQEFLEKSSYDEARKFQLSSKKLKLKLSENYKKTGQLIKEQTGHEQCIPIGEGPSLQVLVKPSQILEKLVLAHVMPEDKLLSCDIVLCIRCDGWPKSSGEWLTRDRLWPNKDITRKVYQEGFHIVAKSSLEGNFRLSFSNAESILMDSLNTLQHKVARAFKAIIKYYQNSWNPNIKKVICSYHLKTQVFWHVENFTGDSWAEENVVDHLLTLLDEFAQALKKGYLPMYFLPKYNLLGNVNDLEEMKVISDKVAELSTDIPAIITALDKMLQIDVDFTCDNVRQRLSSLGLQKLDAKDVAKKFRQQKAALPIALEKYKKILEYPGTDDKQTESAEQVLKDSLYQEEMSAQFLEMSSEFEELQNMYGSEDKYFEDFCNVFNYMTGADQN